MEQNFLKHIVIAAGGTGGHIFPGISIGEAILKFQPSIKITYISGSKDFEKEIYLNEGKTTFQIPVLPTAKGFTGKIKSFLNYFKARSILIEKFKKERPDAVLGMGGYVSAPALAAAKKLGIPFFIHEQNSVPGKVNRHFAASAKKCFCTFNMAMDYFPKGNSMLSGLPLRKQFLSIPEKTKARELFNLRSGVFTIFISGGSQGAKFFNFEILKSLSMIEESANIKENIQVLWSVGKLNFEETEKLVNDKKFKKVQIQIKPFIKEMEYAITSADLIISRAGAGSIAEIAALEKASVLVPLPTAADDHQRYNAMEINKAGAAEIIEQNSLASPNFLKVFESLYSDKNRIAEMEKNSKKFSKTNSSEIIAETILSFFKPKFATGNCCF